MPTPAEILGMAASLQNDTAQQIYTNAAMLPYLNMALRDLQELFELYNIPSTNVTSAVINAPAGTTTVSFGGSPALPSDLIDIQELWQSNEGQNQWINMVRKEFLPHYLEGAPTNYFLVWAWIGNEIKLLPSTSDLDLKLDYIKSIFNTITMATVDTELGAKYKNIISYLGYRTAALCSIYIGENPERANSLSGEAGQSLSKSLGISIKGGQEIGVRRRPYRQSWKSRGII